VKRVVKQISEMTGIAALVQKGLEKYGAVEVTLSAPKRTLPQNELIHAVFKECADKTKIKNAEWWKTELKEKLGKKQVHFDLEENPSVITVSTTKYKKKEISDFVEKIKHHMAANYQVQIVMRGEYE